MTRVIVFAAVAQRLVLLALFVALGVRAVKRSRPASHP